MNGKAYIIRFENEAGDMRVELYWSDDKTQLVHSSLEIWKLTERGWDLYRLKDNISEHTFRRQYEFFKSNGWVEATMAGTKFGYK